MKKVITLFSLIFLLASCAEEDPIIRIEPEDDKCNLEVFVYQCSSLQCQNQLPLFQYNIELYPSYEEALSGSNLIRSQGSNSEGKALFSGLDCEVVFVRVETENFGTYIANESLAANATLNYHDIRFINGLVYNDGEISSLKQNHISLSAPVVGQVSKYIYHKNYDHISFTPLEYTDVQLEVRIIDQISENRFLVEEKIDSLVDFLTIPLYPGVLSLTNVWRFENDSLFVEPYGNEYYGSYVWNLANDWIQGEENGWGFSLKRPAINGIDMSTDEVYDLDGWWGTGFASEYTLFGQVYTDLITDKISYIGWDGPLKLRVYNNEDGLVRSLDFFSGGSVTTHGFDLVR